MTETHNIVGAVVTFQASTPAAGMDSTTNLPKPGWGGITLLDMSLTISDDSGGRKVTINSGRLYTKPGNDYTWSYDPRGSSSVQRWPSVYVFTVSTKKSSELSDPRSRLDGWGYTGYTTSSPVGARPNPADFINPPQISSGVGANYVGTTSAPWNYIAPADIALVGNQVITLADIRYSGRGSPTTWYFDIGVSTGSWYLKPEYTNALQLNFLYNQFRRVNTTLTRPDPPFIQTGTATNQANFWNGWIDADNFLAPIPLPSDVRFVWKMTTEGWKKIAPVYIRESGGWREMDGSVLP